MLLIQKKKNYLAYERSLVHFTLFSAPVKDYGYLKI